MHDSLLSSGWFSGFWLVEDRVGGLTARGCSLRRIKASRVSDPDRSFPPARRFASSPSIRERRELNPGQWCLFAPVQPGNEIKFAMFQTKPNVPNKSQV
jgi:hypothetical protein